MKIDSHLPQINSYNNNNKTRKSPSFTGGADVIVRSFDTLLRSLDVNQAWGANAVDFFFMVLPRTATDFTRGTDAGLETARRESMGTINDSSVGLYGSLAGLILANGINSAYGLKDKNVKAHSVFTDSETMNMMADIWHNKLHKQTNEPLKEFLKEVWKNYEALSPIENGKWIKVDDSTIDKIIKIQEREILSGSKDMAKQALNDAKNLAISSSGVENNFRIVTPKNGKAHTSRYTLDAIFENAHKLGQLFTKDNIKTEFMNAQKWTDVNFVKAMKSMNLKRSLWGVGIASAIGVSVQPINMYLTKKRTGSEKFVGGGEKDSSFGFKVRKALVGLGFGAFVLATIGNPKNLIKNLQFKGFSPTINQLKFVYGITIISRFLAARNDNELKESSIKDVLGFTNWLILGNFVQKLVAEKMDKSLIKRNGEGLLKWIKNSSLMTRDEVLHRHLGKDAFNADGSAKTFKQMVDAVSNNKIAKKQLRALTVAQVVGYAYSGLVLGLGIPNLNKYLTNKRMAKLEAQKAKDAQNNMAKVEHNVSDTGSQVNQFEKIYTPSNIKFLNEFTGDKNYFANFKR